MLYHIFLELAAAKVVYYPHPHRIKPNAQMAHLFSRLIILSLLLKQINSYKTSLKQLKPALLSELLAHQEKFVISFQGVNPAQILYPKNTYQRYMTFSPKYNRTINETGIKYTPRDNIVIAYLSGDKVNTKLTFHNFCLRPNSIFIFFIDCLYAGKSCTTHIVPIHIFYSPAIKIFIFPRSYTNTRKLMGAVSSAGIF